MVKVKTFVCSGCNKKFKNQRSKTLHMKSCIYLKYNQELAKDIEIDMKNKQCDFCLDLINKKSYKRHLDRCHKKIFLGHYLKFFDFLFSLVLRYNTQIRQSNCLGDDQIIKYFIKDYKLKNVKTKEDEKKIEEEFINDKEYVRHNHEIYIKIIENLKNEKLKEQNNILEELQIDRKNKNIEKIFELVDIVKKQNCPLLSFRQIILDFINEQDSLNELIIKRINKRYQKKDFLTNEEINEISDNLAAKILDLYVISQEYDDCYKKIYNMIEEFNKNKEKYQCSYCKRYILHKFQHYRKCKMIQKNFYKNKAHFFWEFINKNYTNTQLEKVNLSAINKKYIKNDFHFFINNIHENIISTVEFEERYALSKKNTYKIIKKKYKNKTILINEKKINHILFMLDIDICCEFKINKLKDEQTKFLRDEIINELKIHGICQKDKIIEKFKQKYIINFSETMKNELNEKEKNNNNNVSEKLFKNKKKYRLEKEKLNIEIQTKKTDEKNNEKKYKKDEEKLNNEILVEKTDDEKDDEKMDDEINEEKENEINERWQNYCTTIFNIREIQKQYEKPKTKKIIKYII